MELEDLPTFIRTEEDTRQSSGAAAWAVLIFIFAIISAGSCLIGFWAGLSAP